MFKIVEVNGSSEKGFSEAVRGSIERLIAVGEMISYFPMVEQRAAAREGKFKEFQVKLKVAVIPTEEKVASAL
jgi:flavin-binding protein dodecin